MSINHLNIEQATSSIEVVSSSVIDKLYELAQNPSLDSGSNIQGNLQVTHAYQDAIDYLLNKFPNLQINVTGGAYIRFADDAVRKICAENWGDGIGITAAQAAAVSSIRTKFKGNTEIVSFNELKQIANVNCLLSHSFEGCSLLQSINIDNIQTIGEYSFYNCKSLSCDIFINIPILTGAIFRGCSSLNKVTIGIKCTNMYWRCFQDCISLKYVKVLPSIPPTFSGSDNFSNSNNCPIYVPDESVDVYKSATGWSTYSTRIKALSTFATDFPNG